MDGGWIDGWIEVSWMRDSSWTLDRWRERRFRWESVRECCLGYDG